MSVSTHRVIATGAMSIIDIESNYDVVGETRFAAEKLYCIAVS